MSSFHGVRFPLSPYHIFLRFMFVWHEVSGWATKRLAGYKSQGLKLGHPAVIWRANVAPLSARVEVWETPWKSILLRHGGNV